MAKSKFTENLLGLQCKDCKRINYHTRKNKKRGIREISEYFASEKPGRRAEAQPEIEFDRPLTPTETTVINGFLEGKRQVDIARELQIPTSGVHEILKRIRKIARRKT